MIYKELNDVLESLPFEAILAGGCVRDTVLGKDIKDYDVYAWDTYETRIKLYEAYPNHIDVTENDEHAYEAGNFSVVNTQAVAIDGNPIQVMLLDKVEIGDCATLQEYVEKHFDFGICKATYHKLGGLHLTEAFNKDVANKTITYYESDLNWYNPDRAERMLAKFPDYELVE